MYTRFIRTKYMGGKIQETTHETQKDTENKEKKKIALKKKIKWDKFTMFTAKQNREWTERRMNEKKNIKNDGSWCWWWWSKYSLHKIDS